MCAIGMNAPRYKQMARIDIVWKFAYLKWNGWRSKHIAHLHSFFIQLDEILIQTRQKKRCEHRSCSYLTHRLNSVHWPWARHILWWRIQKVRWTTRIALSVTNILRWSNWNGGKPFSSTPGKSDFNLLLCSSFFIL